jgi:hypothetical protein
MSLFPSPKANDFLNASDGSQDFGFIDDDAAKALGVAAGAIRLQVGFPGANGWGAEHVLSNDDRMARLKEIGFRSLMHYVETVCRGFHRISDGGNGRLTLVHEFQNSEGKALELEVIVLGKEHGGRTIWSVTTVIPKRVSRSTVLYKCPKKEVRTERSEPSLGGVSNRPRRETLSLPKNPKRDGKGS